MKILYLINGLGFSKNTGIGGADKRAVEVVREASKSPDNPSNSFAILTTESGRRIFETSEGLKTKYYTITRPFWWPDVINHYLIGRVLSYLYATIYSLTLLPKLKDYDIFFSSSDFFFDTIPCFFAKVFMKRKFVAMIHHHIKNPFSRKGTLLINIFMYLSQRFSLWFIGTFSDYIFLYDTEEGRSIRTLFKKRVDKIFFYVQNGITPTLIDEAQEPQTKIYDACFVGGIRYNKGIKDFVPIWKKVIKMFPKAKFLVVGGGSKEIVDDFTNKVKENRLENYIIFTGALPNTEVYEKMKASKLFLFPSYEEGWGIVVCEAMYCKLPIICYDLPAYKVFGEKLDKAKPGDWETLADYVINYLEHPEQIEKVGESLKKVAAAFTWEIIAKKELQIFEEIVNAKN